MSSGSSYSTRSGNSSVLSANGFHFAFPSGLGYLIAFDSIYYFKGFLLNGPSLVVFDTCLILNFLKYNTDTIPAWFLWLPYRKEQARLLSFESLHLKLAHG